MTIYFLFEPYTLPNFAYSRLDSTVNLIALILKFCGKRISNDTLSEHRHSRGKKKYPNIQRRNLALDARDSFADDRSTVCVNFSSCTVGSWLWKREKIFESRRSRFKEYLFTVGRSCSRNWLWKSSNPGQTFRVVHEIPNWTKKTFLVEMISSRNYRTRASRNEWMS